MASLADLLGETVVDLNGNVAYPAVPKPRPRPNWIVEPDLLSQQTGSWVTPEMEMRYEDTGNRAYWRDTGEPVQIVPRERLLPFTRTPDGVELTMPKIADILGFVAGGTAPKGGVVTGSGMWRKAREVSPSVYAEDPTVADLLARQMEAMHKRGSQGYVLEGKNKDALFNPPGKEDLAKADKALTTVSTKEPLPRYADAAQRALDMGFDTPAFHVTNMTPEADTIKKLAGTPFREMDPTVGSRGAAFFGGFETPTGPLTSGAAQYTSGTPRVYPYLVKDVLGEHPLPPGLNASLPDAIQVDQWKNLSKDSLGDLLAGMLSTAGYEDNIMAAIEAAKARFGKSFSQNVFDVDHEAAANTVARMLAQTYFRATPDGAPGMLQKVDAFDFQPLKWNSSALMPYGEFELGAVKNLAGQAQSGLHSPVQNQIGAIGFSGARVRDEMAKVNGKTYAMIDPFGVRAVGAKFKNPFGDLLSASVPPGAFFNAPAPQYGDQR